MTITESIKSSLLSMKAHKLRSFLTMLGMIIGISSVVIVMSVGAGAQSLILNQFKTTGSAVIAILPGAADEEGPPASALGIVITTLKYEDARALEKKSNAPHLLAVAAYTTGTGTISWQNQSTDTNFVGTTASYTIVEDADVERGRFISEEEERNLARVVVLGSIVAEDLFGDMDPVGQKIKIKKEMFEVIGVMKERGVQFFVNQDDQVFIPLKTAQKIMLGINHVNYIRAKVDDDKNIDPTMEDVRATLREQHDILSPINDDFSVRNTKMAMDVITQVTDVLKYFLAAIAALALVVGGVGIMNIMLVAVNQRIREIGLRKAVGAKRSQIMTQFLTETVSISLTGGVIGILIGAGVSALVAFVAQYLGYSWDLVITPMSVVTATGVSILVGLVFGMYPARKAAGLDPIEALRYE